MPALPLRPPSRRPRWLSRCALPLLLAASALVAVPARAAPTLPERLDAARLDAGVAPRRALASLEALAAEAQAQGRPDWRLEADEIACRVQSDLDVAAGLRVAEAGLASVGAAPPDAARLAWLRLRACRAGVLVDGGIDRAAGEREMEAVLALSTGEALVSAHALALLERGVHRSRSGDLERGQADLIAACDSLRPHGRPGDLDLCLGHLANHYRRAGDLAEALRLSTRLREASHARGATFDESVHLYAVALIHEAQADWPRALAAYRDAAVVFARLNDLSGLSYAEHGTAMALWKTGHAAEALAQEEQAMRRLQPGADPTHQARMGQLHAELLLGAGRAAQAQAELAAIETAMRATGEGPSLASWLVAQAGALKALGRWREALQLLEEAREVEAKLHRAQLSEQSAWLRVQFDRARDAEDLSALRQLNAQGQRLRNTQAVALGLFVLLLIGSSVFAWRKLRQARHLQSVALSDELTGLPNRRAVLAQAEVALAQARRDHSPVAVLMVDVDHFKRINDTHGHAVGDEVLRHLARVLPAGLRSQDRLGRLGGEEFLAVLPGASLAQACQAAERMRAAVAASPLQRPADSLGFTVSIGVADGGAPGDSVAALVDRADAALYRAKHGGRNAVAASGAAPQAALQDVPQVAPPQTLPQTLQETLH